MLLELRLNGATLLKGYNNQVLTSADGTVEPQVAMDAALRCYGVVGDTATCVGEVPKMPFCSWRRTLAQRVGRYALVVDEMTFRADSKNMKVVTEWSPVSGHWQAKENLLKLKGATDTKLPPGWRYLRALDATCTAGPGDPDDLLSRLGSINIMLLKAGGPGTWMEMTFELEAARAGEVFAEMLNYKDRGKVRFLLDGHPAGDEFDHYSSGVSTTRVSLGTHQLGAGSHRLRVEVTGMNPTSTKHYVGLRGISLRSANAPDPATSVAFELHPSELVDVPAGNNMVWNGEVKSGQRRVAFYLLSQRPAAKDSPLGCIQMTENTAVLALPEPGLAIVREHQGTKAQLAILATTHIFGRDLERAGLEARLVSASTPVDLDWDLAAGALAVNAAGDCELALRLDDGTALELDGKPCPATPKDGLLLVSLTAGNHVLSGAVLPEAFAAEFATQLTSQLAAGRAARVEQTAAAAKRPERFPALTETMSAVVGPKPVASTVIPSARGDRVCIASGKIVHVLGADGAELQRLEADGPIRVLRWWQEHKLLLVGCQDEKVIAFDEAGERKWEFVSEMDQAVWEAAKQYWFKSAHPGIYGLHTDLFIDGKSQCFIGGACTLEIIDEHGKLVKRLPIFWGPGWQFKVIDAKDGSRNLLVARQPTNSHALTVVNSKTLKITGNICDGVPSGHTYVTGWATMSSNHIHCLDLDGDGKNEMVTAVNGIWNRVTVWNDAGSPLYNAQFGPGKRIPSRNLRDLAVADLNGDGKHEIVVATWQGLVVALDHQCKTMWSKRLTSPPNVLDCVTTEGAGTRIVVGCDNGKIVVLDGSGTPVRQAKLNARAARLDLVRTPQGPMAVFTSSKGEVKGFVLK